MNFSLKTVLKSVKSVKSASKNQQSLYICREASTNPPFLCKTNPNYAVFSPKTAILPKNEPKTNPIKPKTKPNLGNL